MLGLEEVEPLPVPSSPAMMQEMPSVKMPLGNNTSGLVPTAAIPQRPCPGCGGTGRGPAGHTC